MCICMPVFFVYVYCLIFLCTMFSFTLTLIPMFTYLYVGCLAKIKDLNHWREENRHKKKLIMPIPIFPYIYIYIY